MKIPNLILGAFFLLVVAGNIHAASFDCEKATSEVEKIICSDDELSKLDESLNQAYLQALEQTLFKKRTIKSQRQWMKNERNACRDAECMKEAYETRITELGLADADDDLEKEDITRSLTMTCDYSDDGTLQLESVSITQTKNDQGKPAAIKKFKRGQNRKEHETFIVWPGQFAECIFPSGTRVRVKVGVGIALPYGECGADPELFMSLWVNKRKIASRVWFAGNCSESRQNPAVSFEIPGTDNGVSVQRCHSARQGGDNLTPESENTKKQAAKPLSVCVNFPDISKYPRDFVEYPPEGTKTPKGGDIEILYGSGPVCQAAANELKRDSSLSHLPARSKTELSRPTWNNTLVELPKELGGCVESIFDFNNDGKLDRVFHCDFFSRYMLGSVLLVQPGRSSSKLMVSASPMDSTSNYLPFQIDKVHKNIYDYPPFSQENDNAGFSMKGRNEKNEVHFWGRSSWISPFNFHGTSYIAVSTYSEDTKYFVAVLKPLPDGTFEKIGLLRRVPENF